MLNVQKTRLLASGLLAITFVVGALVGAAGERVLTAREPKPVEQQVKKQDGPGRRPRGAGRSIFLEPGVFDQIGATAQQRAAIEQILQRREQGARRLWGEFGPRMNAMMDSTRGEIRANLTEEQRKKLDALIEEKRAQHNKNHDNSQPQKSTPEGASKSHDKREPEPFI